MVNVLKKYRYYLLIVAILLISSLLRFYNLGSNPPSLSMDEIGFGYNAYSILKTGRDEFGKFMPFSFQAIGDYKLPVEIYLTVPSIILFGISELAIRFPAAFFGSISPIIFILILSRLNFSKSAACLTGSWFALSCWHIFLSRGSYETVIALFLILTGLLLFLYFLNTQKSIFIILAAVLFGLSIWTYNAARLFVPLLLIFLFATNHQFILKTVIKKKITVLAIFVICLIFILPFIYLSLTGDSIIARAKELWFTKDPQFSSSLHNGNYELPEFLFDNDLYLTFRYWLRQYLNYFDLKFWFLNGLRLTPSDYQGIGILYMWDLPVIFLGAFQIFKSKISLTKALTIFWLLIGPLAGSLTRGEESQVRSLIWLPFFGFCVAYAFEWILQKRQKVWLISTYSLLIIFNLFYFFDLYSHNFHKFYGDLWHFGYKEVALYACQNKDKYDQILITNKYGSYWPSVNTVPYLYVLYYCQFDPGQFLKDRKIYNITGKDIYWETDLKLNNTLIIASAWGIPKEVKKDMIIKKIKFLNGQDALYFIETK